MLIYYIPIFTIGLLIGSFLNVCIYRMPREESISFPPSHCTNCKDRIKPYDLIPVVSYLLLRGKCRNCGEKISSRYPIIEFLTGIIFILSFYKFGFTIDFIKSIVLLSMLIIATFIDLEYTIIPGKLMIFGAISGIVLDIIGYKFNGHLLTYLYGLMVGGGAILLIVLVTGAMGGGDIQLMGVIGLFLGLKLTLLTLMLSFILGAMAGVTLIILKKKSRRDYIPFGPWISLAAFISLFLGEDIIGWYISLL